MMNLKNMNFVHKMFKMKIRHKQILTLQDLFIQLKAFFLLYKKNKKKRKLINLQAQTDKIEENQKTNQFKLFSKKVKTTR